VQLEGLKKWGEKIVTSLGNRLANVLIIKKEKHTVPVHDL
jgi:hypothetical protein